MKKENVKVAVTSKEQGMKLMKALKSLGEIVNKKDCNFPCDNIAIYQGGIYFNSEYKVWCIASSFGNYKQECHRELITFGQLVDLLTVKNKSVNVPLFDFDNQCIIYSENNEVRIWTKGGGVCVKHSDIEDIYHALNQLK